MKRLSIIMLLIVTVTGSTWGQRGVRISPPGESWIDPEILFPGDKLTFQTSSGQVWISDIDPVSGLFRSGHERDVLVDSNATSPTLTLNGPEFGIDRDGWSVFYTKEQDGIPQIWKADPAGGSFRHTVLTSGPRRHQSALASKNDTATSMRFLFTIGFLNGQMAWGDADIPGSETIVDSVDRGVRWIDNTNSFVYVKQTGASKGELAIYDTDNDTETIITADGIPKSHPYGWRAPEYNGELLALVMLDGDTALGIYRNSGRPHWQLVREIPVPGKSPYRYFGSPEPFVAAGKSYISCVIKQQPDAYSNGDVWIFSLQEGKNITYAKRIEDDLGTAVRSDPEAYAGENQVFVYYNVRTPAGIFEVYRAGTGIVTLRSSGLVSRSILPSETDPDIDGYDEPHYVLIDTAAVPLEKLFVFFPGTNARPYDYLKFAATAATMGYHCISLGYENNEAINFDLCPRTQDTTCHHRARYEIWFGEDRHPDIAISRANGIVHRLTSLLRYLRNTYPNENWKQFLDARDSIRWERIVAAGHSQGGGHAGFVAKYFPVDRSIMFAATDWLSPGRTADWIRMPGRTPENRYYGFVHTLDVPIANLIAQTWSDYGMLRYGSLVDVDSSHPPYNNTHALTTSRTLPQDASAHNYPIVDFETPSDNAGRYMYSDTWRYLLGYEAVSHVEHLPDRATVHIFPQPAHSILTVTDGSSRAASFAVFTLLGQRVLEGLVLGEQIDISQLPAGSYVLRLLTYSRSATMVRFTKW